MASNVMKMKCEQNVNLSGDVSNMWTIIVRGTKKQKPQPGDLKLVVSSSENAPLWHFVSSNVSNPKHYLWGKLVAHQEHERI